MMNNQRGFQQNMVMGSGLTRYRSAPCSYFSTLLNSSNIMGDDGIGEDEFERLLNPPASSPETQKFFSRFMNNSETIQENCSSDMKSQSQINPQYPPPRKSESSVHKPRQELQRQQSNNFSSSVPHMMYQIINSGAANSDMQDWDYGLMDSLNSNSAVQMKTEESGGGANLIRHRSSPAGLFENINIKNELGAANLSPATVENSHGEGENRDKNGGYSLGFPVNSWDDSIILPDSFFKGLTDNHQQSIEGGSKHAIPKLSHHLSLPKNLAELLAMEKLMQGSVPCKIRAKRGFATHPRSIAERVRKTKISERMRKLQDLIVPNMEKVQSFQVLKVCCCSKQIHQTCWI